MLIQMEGKDGTNLIALMDKFVEQDPYIKNGLVQSYSVDPVVMTHQVKDFDRLASDFIERA